MGFGFAYVLSLFLLERVLEKKIFLLCSIKKYSLMNFSAITTQKIKFERIISMKSFKIFETKLELSAHRSKAGQMNILLLM